MRRRQPRCSHCGSTRVTKDDAGFFVCAQCGTVVQNVRQTERDTDDLLFSYTGSRLGEGVARATKVTTARKVNEIPPVIREYIADWQDVKDGRPFGPTEGDYFMAMQNIFRFCIRTVSEEFSLGSSGEQWEVAAKKCWLLILDGFAKNELPVQSIWADSSRHSLRVHPSRIEGLLEGETGEGLDETLNVPLEIAQFDVSSITAEAYRRVVARMGPQKGAYVRDLIGDTPETRSPQSKKRSRSDEVSKVKDQQPVKMAKLEEEELRAQASPEKEVFEPSSGQDVSETPPSDLTPPSDSTPPSGEASSGSMINESPVTRVKVQTPNVTSWTEVDTGVRTGHRRKRYPDFMGMHDRREDKRKARIPSVWESLGGLKELHRNALHAPLQKMGSEFSDRGLMLQPYLHDMSPTAAQSARLRAEHDTFFAMIHAIYDHDFIHALLLTELELLKTKTPEEVNAEAEIPQVLKLLSSTQATGLVEAISKALAGATAESWAEMTSQLDELYRKASEHASAVYRLNPRRFDSALNKSVSSSNLKDEDRIEDDLTLLRNRAMVQTLEGLRLRRRQKQLADKLIRSRVRGTLPTAHNHDLKDPTIADLLKLFDEAIQETRLPESVLPLSLQLCSFPQAVPTAWIASDYPDRVPVAPGQQCLLPANRRMRTQALHDLFIELTQSQVEAALPALARIRLDMRVLFPLLLLSARLSGLPFTGADLIRWSIDGRVPALSYLARQANLVPHWLQEAAFRLATSGNMRYAAKKTNFVETSHFSPLTPSSGVALEEQTARLMEALKLQNMMPSRFLQLALLPRLLHILFLPPQLQTYVVGLLNSLSDESLDTLRSKETVTASKVLYLDSDDKLTVSSESLAAAVIVCCRLFWTAFRQPGVQMSDVQGESRRDRPAWARAQGWFVQLGETLTMEPVMHGRLERFNFVENPRITHQLLGVPPHEGPFGPLQQQYALPKTTETDNPAAVPLKVVERPEKFEKDPRLKYPSLKFPHLGWRYAGSGSIVASLKPLPTPATAAVAHRAGAFLGRPPRTILSLVSVIEKCMSMDQ